jgi:hypothetical protein
VLSPRIEQAIRRAAAAHGEDPATALAIAERESSFNPNAKSSKTIEGLFQMRGDLRRQYGIPNGADPETQANGYMPFFKDTKAEMARVLGRQPTDAEAYLGHHYGATRAARTLNMAPDTPVAQVFTPDEMAQNPHFGKAGTIGNLNSSIMSDIETRRAKFGGEGLDFSQAVGAPPAEPMDFSGKATPVADKEDQPDYQANLAKNKKWAKPGNYRTDLGDQEPAFQKWVADNKVPFDVNKTGPDDYDMRGFWQGAQRGDPRASTAPNPNDGQIHYDDKWKTPYHKSFSSESQWAQPNAPTWNDKDQLVDPSNGSVVFDEKAPVAPPAAPALDFSGQAQQ